MRRAITLRVPEWLLGAVTFWGTFYPLLEPELTDEVATGSVYHSYLVLTRYRNPTRFGWGRLLQYVGMNART
jgi:hypothetical protein